MKKIMILIGIASTLLVCGNAFAIPVMWAGNGHYYEAISDATATWDQARANAEGSTYLGLTGHLATITSQQENDFIWSLGNPYYHFIGGFQPAGSAEPNGGWQWVTTGESWAYTNWNLPTEPNNTDGVENVVQLWTNGKWNDVDKGFHHDGQFYRGYIVEYSTIGTSSVVPEPSSMILLGVGLLGAGVFKKKKTV